MHLEGLAAYVQQLEDGVIGSRTLIKAYKKARVDNFPWVRALGFVQRQMTGRLPGRNDKDTLMLPVPEEPRALKE
jgi:hypothetical protein